MVGEVAAGDLVGVAADALEHVDGGLANGVAMNARPQARARAAMRRCASSSSSKRREELAQRRRLDVRSGAGSLGDQRVGAQRLQLDGGGAGRCRGIDQRERAIDRAAVVQADLGDRRTAADPARSAGR